MLIPPAVAQEFGRSLPDCVEIRPGRENIGIRILNASLGRGESEALALALEVEADLVLLHDRAARHLAAVLGLSVMGTLGLLLRAKAAGLISEIRPSLDALRALPFHISPRLYAGVLASAGESSS